MSDVVSIVIPSFNGASLLRENLPGVLAAAEECPWKAEIVVVDDGSRDGSVEMLQKCFKSVVPLKLKRHAGFIQACESGIRKSSGTVVVLLNNDISVDKDFLIPLLAHFEHDEVFAVTAKSLVRDASGRLVNEAPVTGKFHQGFLLLEQSELDPEMPALTRACYNFHASCGFSAFDRRKFLELGGLDPRYHPFYWEDVDISFRAWKRGWCSVYEPRSTVWHESHSTIARMYRPEFINLIYERNRFFFIWKNIREPRLIEEHMRAVDKRLRSSQAEDRVFREVFYTAFRKIRNILQTPCLVGDSGVSDEEVFTLSSAEREYKAPKLQPVLR